MPLNGVDAWCSSRKLTACLLQACYWPPVDLDSKWHNISCHLYALSERQGCLYTPIQSYTSYYAWNDVWNHWNKGKPVSGFLGMKKDTMHGRLFEIHASRKWWFFLCMLSMILKSHSFWNISYCCWPRLQNLSRSLQPTWSSWGWSTPCLMSPPLHNYGTGWETSLLSCCKYGKLDSVAM